MQAMEMDFSPGLPSFRVTTRRRMMPQGTSFSFLQAVTQALHSMQRSLSQRNFMRAIIVVSGGGKTRGEGGGVGGWEERRAGRGGGGAGLPAVPGAARPAP